MSTLKLLQLIKDNQEDFLVSTNRRMATSTGNKHYHESMSFFLVKRDYRAIEEMLTDEWYHKALEGVIVCMNMYCGTSSQVISNMMNALEELRNEPY